MTLQELYGSIGEDYEQAIRVMRMDKLVDKHIRKLPGSGLIERLAAAGETMDPTAMFEAAHAMKGVCGNLGLANLASAVSEITEEFRPGKDRKMTDAEVAGKLQAISARYAAAADAISRYAEEHPL